MLLLDGRVCRWPGSAGLSGRPILVNWIGRRGPVRWGLGARRGRSPVAGAAGPVGAALDVPQQHLLGEVDLAREQRPDRLAAVDADGSPRRSAGPAIERTILPPRFSGGIGTESVTTTSRRFELRDPLHRRIRQDGVRGAGVDLGRRLRVESPTISISVPAVSISSSTMMARLPRTSPMTLSTSARSWFPIRRFSTMASGASSSSAKVRARLAKPRSVTTTRFSMLLLAEVARQQMDRGQLVDGDVEEALDLALVQVHRQYPVCAGDGEHVGDQAGSDRNARLILLVRAAVAVVRNDGRDPARRWPA